ncbi:MAG: hypothetical protein QOI11_2954 [Candidatus Eremiobacteraeota bacterium]|jgi:hypothetical protein|nr:hypothetical protein [Candidatus Eremiobacteraeota bacterium]
MTSRSGALGGALAVGALVLTAVLYNAVPVRGSDHQDSPAVVSHHSADITDVFVYPAGDNPANVVLQMNVDPLLAPGAQTTSEALDPAVLYQFKIAHGSATAEDMVIQVQPSGTGTSQTISVSGPAAPATTGTLSTALPTTGTVPFNSAAAPALSNGLKVFVGPRADPFFFDLFAFFKFLPDRNYKTPGTSAPAGTTLSFNFPSPAGAFANCLQGTPSDALSANNFNVLSIVVEAPRALIAPASGSQQIHVWATTSTTSGS